MSCLAWNTDHPNLVAVGYKKLKAGSSLLLYDVQSGGAFRSSTGTTSDTRGNRCAVRVCACACVSVCVCVCVCVCARV